jgi:MFS family permease
VAAGEVAADQAAAAQVVPLRHNRDFLWLWSGQAVSVLGSQISAVAYPLLVLAMTGPAAKAGVAGFAAGLPYLLFPLLAGAVADRWNRKRIMICCDTLRLAALASIAAAMTLTAVAATATPAIRHTSSGPPGTPSPRLQTAARSQPQQR